MTENFLNCLTFWQKDLFQPCNLGIWALVFGLYLAAGRRLTWPWALALGGLLRLLFWVHEPGLSEDYFRFLWDGRLFWLGEHPFAHTPSAYWAASGGADAFLAQLYPGLNSPDYYSIYPPAAQLYFIAAAYPADLSWSLGFLRLGSYLADGGIVWLLYRLLPEGEGKLSLWYWLNPLVIIEFSGNLHFENLQILALLACFYALKRQAWLTSALCLSLAIQIKLLPLLALPLILKQLYVRRGLGLATTYALGVVVPTVLGLALLLGYEQVYLHMGQSLDLYWRRFEFNGSVYLLLREGLSALIGYNPIAFLGPILVLLALVYYAYTWWRYRAAQPIYPALLSVWGGYYLLATTVHPWYALNLLPLAILWGLERPWARFSLLWTGTVFCSYLYYPWPSGLWAIIPLVYGLPFLLGRLWRV